MASSSMSAPFTATSMRLFALSPPSRPLPFMRLKILLAKSIFSFVLLTYAKQVPRAALRSGALLPYYDIYVPALRGVARVLTCLGGWVAVGLSGGRRCAP